MAIRTLSIDIMSYLKGQGFQAVNNQINGLKSSLSSLKSVASNGLFQMAAGYFAISKLTEQYNKAVEASNLQLENETKLYATLRAQSFRDEQIQGLKDYASELQKTGVVGDEVSLAGIRQLAVFKLNDESIRELLPQVHNLMVAEKGLKSTSMDAEKYSKSLGIAVTTGQVRALKQAGIVLDEHTQKVFENATQQERIAILAEEIKERVGEQNAEFLKTPEGKIVSAQNRIGDVYEYIGGLLRDTRADFWSMIADNAEWIQDFLGGLIKAGAGAFNTITRTIGGMFNVLKALPSEARNTIKLITGFLLLKKFPIMGGFLIIEDIFAAFLGKESFTEDAINAILKFTGTDYRFEDLRKGIADFWDLWINKADSGIEKISLTTKILSDLLDILQGGAGLLQMLWGATGGFIIDTGRILLGDFENVGKSSFGNIKGGWNKLHGAGQHMNETSEMYDKYLLDEALEQQKKEFKRMEYVQKNQGNIAFPIEREIVIPDSAPVIPFTSYKLPRNSEAYYSPRLPDKKITQDTKQKVEKSVVKKENKKFEYVNNSKYEIKVIGEAQNDATKKIEGVVRRIQEEEKQRLRAEFGGNFTQAGGLE